MDYTSIIASYHRKFRPLTMDELDWFIHQPTIELAIEKAALAQNRQGRRFSHQWRITRQALMEAKKALLGNKAEIEKCENFDQLFTVIDQILAPIPGIGEMYVYDTSFRIGAKLDLFPERVYLHRGTRSGAEALRATGQLMYEDDDRAVEVSRFPIELQELPPHEIEDVLCIYKLKLAKVNTKHALPCRNC